jgi:hypothetical protein
MLTESHDVELIIASFDCGARRGGGMGESKGCRAARRCLS